MTDGERITERIRPSPPPAPSPAREPSIEEETPEESGQRAPDFGVSEDEESKADNLVKFPAKTSRRGRKKKRPEETYRVEYVKPSKGTWAFCIRWTEEDGRRPVVYMSRVNDQLFKSITKLKGRYGNFKKALIASYLSRAIRPSGGIVSGSDCDVRDSSTRQ